VGSAAAGTVLGTAAGALLGAAGGNAGAGAAIGAGGDLLAGSVVGTGTAQASAGSLQDRYDAAYLQCMTASGNRVPMTVAGTPYRYASSTYWGAPSYWAPPPYYGPSWVTAPTWGGPTLSFGFFGDGWRHRHHHFGHHHHFGGHRHRHRR
jgi:Glycine-zipper domain